MLIHYIRIDMVAALNESYTNLVLWFGNQQMHPDIQLPSTELTSAAQSEIWTEQISTHAAYYAPSPPSSHSPRTGTLCLLTVALKKSFHTLPCFWIAWLTRSLSKISLPLFGSPSSWTVCIHSTAVSIALSSYYLLLYSKCACNSLFSSFTGTFSLMKLHCITLQLFI